MLPDAVRKLLASARRIAVVGFSADPARPSHWIAGYLIEAGFQVDLVNPLLHEGHGRPVHASLSALDHAVDIVDVFRAPPHLPQVVEEAIRIRAGAVWMQPGAENAEAAARAAAAGLQVVSGRCLFADHRSWTAAGQAGPG